MFANRIHQFVISLIVACALGGAISAPAQATNLLDRLKAAAKDLQKLNDAAHKQQQQPTQKKPGAAATPGSPVNHAPLQVNAAAAGAKIDKQTLGKPPQGALMTISPAGQHVGWAALAGSRAVMVVDGVAGPPFDALLPDAKSALVFSDDGAHYAYLGRNGDEVSFVLDGKVIGKTPYHSQNQYDSLAFGPHGLHVYFIDYGEYQIQGFGGSAHTVIMDGKAGPLGDIGDGGVAFSPDGRHYAYSAIELPRRRGGFIVYDGARKSFGGGSVSFAADGRILDLRQSATNAELLINGKSILKAAGIQDVHTSPKGGHVVALVQNTAMGTSALWADGRIVASPCEGLQGVWFSKDGNRYIAVCAAASNDRAYAVVDGKKGREYFSIEHTDGEDAPQFTADGAHVMYIAMVQRGGMLSFVIVDGKEFGPYHGVLDYGAHDGDGRGTTIQTSAHGGGYTFVAYADPNSKLNQAIVWNGRTLSSGSNWLLGPPSLSADGLHLAFGAETKGLLDDSLLFYDGKQIPGVQTLGMTRIGQHRRLGYALSPDGTHLAYVTELPGLRGVAVHLDGNTLYSGANVNVNMVTYTDDSRHIFWLASRGAVQPQTLFMDNKPVLTLPPPGPFDQNAGRHAWCMQADGTLQFLAEESDGTVVRYRVVAAAGGK